MLKVLHTDQLQSRWVMGIPNHRVWIRVRVRVGLRVGLRVEVRVRIGDYYKNTKSKILYFVIFWHYKNTKRKILCYFRGRALEGLPRGIGLPPPPPPQTKDGMYTIIFSQNVNVNVNVQRNKTVSICSEGGDAIVKVTWRYCCPVWLISRVALPAHKFPGTISWKSR